MTCKYCKGNHKAIDHAHSPSMNPGIVKQAKKIADFKYKAEAHNRKADALRNKMK